MTRQSILGPLLILAGPLQDLWDAGKRKRGFTRAILVLLGFDLAFGLLALAPLRRHEASRERDLSDLAARAKSAHDDAEARRRLAHDLYRSMSACARFRNEVARTKAEQYIPFKEAIEKLVGVGGQGASGMSFRTADQQGGFIEASTSLEIVGAYGRLRQVLGELVRSPVFVIIDGISVGTGAKGQGGQPRAIVNVTTVFSRSRAADPADPMTLLEGASPGRRPLPRSAGQSISAAHATPAAAKSASPAIPGTSRSAGGGQAPALQAPTPPGKASGGQAAATEPTPSPTPPPAAPSPSASPTPPPSSAPPPPTREPSPPPMPPGRRGPPLLRPPHAPGAPGGIPHPPVPPRGGASIAPAPGGSEEGSQ